MATVTSCFLCDRKACYYYKQRHICLLHFAINRPYQPNIHDGDKEEHYEVLDDAEVEAQTSLVKELWKEAVGDLILRMHELEKEEIADSSNDPLKFLNISETIADPNFVPSSKSKEQKYGYIV